MKKIFLILISISFSLFAQVNNEIADFKLAESLYKDKLYDLALEQFRRYEELYPNTEKGIQAKFYIGLSLFNLKRYEEAKNVFQNFALSYQLNQQAPEAWWKIGECNYHLGRINEAALTFERIKIFHPTSELAPKGLLKSVEYYSSQNDYDNAERVLNMLLSDYYSNDIVIEARLKLADIYLRKDNFDKAIEQYEKILLGNISKERKTLYQMSLGKILATAGKIENAITLFNEIIINNSLNPISDSARIELGKLYSNIGDYENAKKNFIVVVDSAISKKSETDKLALYYLANAEFQLRNYLEALKYIQLFEDKYTNDNNITNIYFLAAEIHRQLGDYIKSNEYLKKLSNSSDEKLQKDALLFSAQNGLDIRNYNIAIDSYINFIEKYPNDYLIPQVIYKIATIYKDYLKDYRRAVQKYEELINKFSTHSLIDDALYNLANSYELNRELDKALLKYNDLLSNYSNSSYYDDAKSKVEHINLYVPLNNTEGFKKIGLLLQDVISNKPKGEISFKLGEVYYNDMKDYKSAKAQFDIATNLDDLNDSLKNVAKYYKMMSNYYILLDEGSITQNDIEEFRNYLSKNPNINNKSDIIIKLFNLQLKGKNEEQVLNICSDFLNNYPNLEQRDIFVSKALKLYENKKDVNKLLQYSNYIIDSIPNSSFFEYAIYLKAYATYLFKKDSLAEYLLNDYVNRFPNGKYLAKTYFLLADLNKKSKNLLRVIEYYNKLKNFFYYTSFADSLDELYAETYYEFGDYKSAFKTYDQLYSNSLNNFFVDKVVINRYLFKLGLCAEKIKDYENAKKYYTQYIFKNVGDLYYNESLLNLALIYSSEGNKEAANSYFKLIKPTTENPELIFKYANILYDNNQYKLALNYLKLLLNDISFNKYKKEIRYKIVLSYLRLANVIEALNEKKLLKKEFDLNDQENAELSYYEGYYYYSNKDYKLAEEIFSDIVSDYEKTKFAGWALFYIGKIKENTNKLQDAIKYYNQVIQKYPTSEAALSANLMIGNYYFNLEKYAEAVKYYRNIVDKPLKDDDVLSAALNNIIESYYQLQIYDAAIEYTRKFIELFPKDEHIFDKKLKIGILYQKLKYFDQAIIHYKSLLSSSKPELEVEIRYYLGECYFSKGDYSTALIEFMKIPYIMDKSVQIDWVPASLYMAGQSYEKLGKYEQAIVMYKQIIDRPNIDNTYKAQAQKEIDRVKSLLLPNKGKE